MCDKENIKKMITFDAYVKKCIKNFSIDYERVEGKKWYNNTLFFNDESELVNYMIHEDWANELLEQKKFSSLAIYILKLKVNF